jgi:hypothetical protein
VARAPGLTTFQLEVQLFFSLAASRGFLLAGGAALLAQHLSSRPIDDLDFFTGPERGHVPSARDELEAAAWQRGWSVERIQDTQTFCRLIAPLPSSSASAWIRSPRRASNASRKPVTARARAVASPMPDEAPVMTTTRPTASSGMVVMVKSFHLG